MNDVDYRQRLGRFEKLRESKPLPGEILRTKDGKKISVFVDQCVMFGSEPEVKLMYCNAAIDRDASGWYLTQELTGLRCLILQRSQEFLVRQFGGYDGIQISELRVVRHNARSTALICEIPELSNGRYSRNECSDVRLAKVTIPRI